MFLGKKRPYGVRLSVRPSCRMYVRNYSKLLLYVHTYKMHAFWLKKTVDDANPFKDQPFLVVVGLNEVCHLLELGAQLLISPLRTFLPRRG